MKRCVVNVATGAHYIKGQDRLLEACALQGADYLHFRDKLPAGCPAHQDVPYAFKAFALWEAYLAGFETILWADACIVPRDLAAVFDRIEAEGVWISRNGWNNDFWTCERAYGDLFPGMDIEAARRENSEIPHVVATTFGLSMGHQGGENILREYYRLASQTTAFCGPWTGGVGVQHRHDQTALSVLAHRNGCVLTNPPEIFAYKCENQDPRTLLVADGGY